MHECLFLLTAHGIVMQLNIYEHQLLLLIATLIRRGQMFSADLEAVAHAVSR